MAEFCSSICSDDCRHPTIAETYQCARKRLDDQETYELDKSTTGVNPGRRSLFSIKHCDGRGLTPDELDELERVRRNWARR